MNAPDVVMEDDVILAEEAPQQVRVAEGIGPQGEWVAWAGGNRKTVRIIAIDDDAFYAKAVPFDKAVALMKELRDGNPPSVALAKGRTIPIDRMTVITVEEHSGGILIVHMVGVTATRWCHNGFSIAACRDLIDELSRRLPNATRWHKAYSRWRAALMPATGVFFFSLLAVGLWAIAAGHLDSDSKSGRSRDEWLINFLKAIGPMWSALLGAAVVAIYAVWLVRSVRNPPIRSGLKSKVKLWGKSKKQPTA